MTSDPVNSAFLMKILPKHLSTAAGARQLPWQLTGGRQHGEAENYERQGGKVRDRAVQNTALGMSRECRTYRRGAG